MLKRCGRGFHLAAQQRPQRGAIELSVAAATAVTLERKTVQLLYDKVGHVNGRVKARELYAVLRILEHALAEDNER